MDQTFVAVSALADLPPDSTLVVSATGISILLCHHDGQIFAIENRCSHADEPLACGRIKYGWIACPAHGARFDLETGAAMNPPATVPIRTFAVRIVDGMIEVAA
jgi:3-phenylpropionate/trans-cinnamate dioxygenase ferredoxin component